MSLITCFWSCFKYKHLHTLCLNISVQSVHLVTSFLFPFQVTYEYVKHYSSYNTELWLAPCCFLSLVNVILLYTACLVFFKEIKYVVKRLLEIQVDSYLYMKMWCYTHFISYVVTPSVKCTSLVKGVFFFTEIMLVVLWTQAV